MTATFRDIRRHAELLHSDDRLVGHLCTGRWRRGDRRDAESWPCRTWTLLDETIDR